MTPEGIAPAVVVVTLAGEVATVVPSNFTVTPDEGAKPEPETAIDEPLDPDVGFKATEATTLPAVLPATVICENVPPPATTLMVTCWPGDHWL